MSSQLGSLPDFLTPIQKIKLKNPQILSGLFSNQPPIPIKNFNTPHPRYMREHQQVPETLHCSTYRKFRHKETFPSLSSLGVYDKIREELMLRNQQRLLRCMHSTIREEERQKTQALLEQRALDMVLKHMNDDLQKPQTQFKKKFSNKIVQSKKSALFTNLLSKERLWIYKRKPLDSPTYQN